MARTFVAAVAVIVVGYLFAVARYVLRTDLHDY
jgi:hypothetical protein